MPLITHRPHCGNSGTGGDRRGLSIAFVNNMRESALPAAERQFSKLLSAAAGDIPVHLSFYALPDVPRSEDEIRRIGRNYAPVGDLWNSSVDGLIVTGTEPSTARLSDEPYWASLSSLIDWAERSTISSVWSCLAAHAVVQHLDGIERRLLSEKLLGVFACRKASEGRLARGLTKGVHDRTRFPHSRWNDVSGIAEAGLAGRYHVLTYSDEAGVDAFIRQGRSLLVCFQGHPEYEADTLLFEYRRDIRRFLAGHSTGYPAMPSGYFDEKSTAVLRRYRERALSAPRENLLDKFPTLVLAARTSNGWNTAAAALYRNWLSYLWEQRSRHDTSRRAARLRASKPHIQCSLGQ